MTVAGSQLPVVYFVFRRNEGASSTRFGGFARRLINSGKMPAADYRTVALDDLTYAIDSSGAAAIYDEQGRALFHDASFVYFKSWESLPERASMVASYLRAKGIPFIDEAVRYAGVHKASQFWKLWAQGIAVVPTIISTHRPSRALVRDVLGDAPYLIKPIHGEKGRGVEKLASYDALPERTDGLLIQPYIENHGDYRVMVYGYSVRGALYRSAQEGKIVNNTSQGAISEFLERGALGEELVGLAERAASTVECAVAGVDVIVDGNGRPYVLEVNQGSQIVTGHFTDKKIEAFGDFMHERIAGRTVRKVQNNRLEVIGRYVNVNFPEFGVSRVLAKVDTGAYQSAVHAADIREGEEDGVRYLEFSLLDGHGKTAGHKTPKCRVTDYDKTTVKNSFGVRQDRYSIKARISINGRMMKTGITLADRKEMAAPILLGRRFLRGRYIVNVELSRIDWEKSL